MTQRALLRILCGFLLASGIVVAQPPARALPCCAVDHWYYDDANFDNIYSLHFITCNSNEWTWDSGWPGQTPTPYEAIWSQNCEGGPVSTWCGVNGQTVTCPANTPPECVYGC
jgi:hypothetical protein